MSRLNKIAHQISLLYVTLPKPHFIGAI